MRVRFLMWRNGGARARSRRAAPARPVRVSIAALLAVLQLAGCYHYVPVYNATIPSGQAVSLGLTDAGRVAMAEAIGPGVRRLSGRVVANTDTSLVVAVNTVDYIDLDTTVRWSGERVTLSRGFISEVRERRISKARSLLMGALVVGGAILASTLAITGFGSDDDNGPGKGPGNSQ